MNRVHYLDQKVSALERYDETAPVTGVALIVDAENEYIAGDDSGYMIEIECPYGTQAMADNILSNISGRVYRGYHATAAELDPLAELGDIITVDGTTSVLLDRVVNFGPGHMSEISAPGEHVLEHEYGYRSPTQRETDRKIAITRSMISKTSEEIQLLVEGVENEYTALKVRVDGVTIEDADGVTKIRGDRIETSTLYVDAAHITGKLAIGSIPDGVATTDNIFDYVDECISDAGLVTESGVTSIVGGMINTDYINALGVRAVELQGAEIFLYNRYDDEIGRIGVGNTTEDGIEFISEGNFQLTSDECFFLLSSRSAIVSCDKLYPIGTAAYLGHTSGGMWQAVYAYTGTIQTSDRNLKHDIEALDDKYVAMLDLIEPKRFKMNSGTSNRYHIGFIAQEVEDAMRMAGVTDLEFAGWCKDKDADGNDVYLLRYEEFIGLLLAKIRELDARVKALEE